MIFKQETIKSWFTGVESSINNEVVQPFQNANSIIRKYNLAMQHNSLTQQGWQRLLAQSDDSLKAYLSSIKGTTASMSGYYVSLQGNIVGFTKITKAMQQYNNLGTTSQKEQQAFATAVGITNTKLGSYFTGLNGAKASLSGYGLSLIASTAKTVGLTIATTALNATLTMGASLILSGLTTAFVSWIHKSEEITEKAQDAADKINAINDSLKSNTETVENAKKRYAELAQGVENLGKTTQSQGTLSNDEYIEFLDLSNQLAGIFPSLAKNYDDNGNAILNLSGDINTIVGSLDSLIQKEKDLANQKIMEEFPDIFKGWNQDLSNTEQKVKSAKTKFDKINNAYQQLSRGSAVQAFEAYDNGVLKGFFLDENGKKVPIDYQEYIQAAKELGLGIKETKIYKTNQYGAKDYEGIRVELTGDIDTAFTSKLETARKDLEYAQQQLEGQKSSINQYLNTWLQGECSYTQIEDSDLQTAIQNILFNFDWTNIPEEKRGNWNYVSEYLRRNILFEINTAQNNPAISKAISEVFTNTDLSPDDKANYLQQIKDFYGKDSAVTFSLNPKIEETETLKKKYEDAIQKTKDKFDGYDPTSFFKEHSINTQEEITNWQKIAQGATGAAEAEKKYIQSLTSHKSSNSSFSQTWESLAKDQKENLLELAKAGKLTPEVLENNAQYSDLLASVGNNAVTAADKINQMVHASDQLSAMQSGIQSISDVLKQKRENLSKKETQKDGIDADTLAGFNDDMKGLDSWDNFEKTLGNGKKSMDDCRKAANQLATEWVNSNNFLSQLDETNKDYYKSELKKMGVEHADAVVTDALAQKKQELKSSELYLKAARESSVATTTDLSKVTAEEINRLAFEQGWVTKTRYPGTTPC